MDEVEKNRLQLLLPRYNASGNSWIDDVEKPHLQLLFLWENCCARDQMNKQVDI